VVSPNVILVVFVWLFWVLLATVFNAWGWIVGRRSGGPSLLPVLLVYPPAAIGVGVAINYAASPWGTWLILGLHLTWVSLAILLAWFRVAPDNNAR
jgi:hypothetical protein